jgi:dTDP-4-dehydrorhamnose reductase
MDSSVRVLVTGGAGLLGRALLRTAPAGFELHATRRSRPVDGAIGHAVDLADARAVAELVGALRPALVIHTAYDKDNLERDVVQATRAIAAAAAACGAWLVHLSTDIVFDGEQAPYGEDAPAAPLNDYGRAKAEAERAVRDGGRRHSIVRTSLIVPEEGESELLRSLRQPEPAQGFVDELRCPIADTDLARQIWELAALPEGERGGAWHLAGPEVISRFALALLVATRHGIPAGQVVPALNRSYSPRRPRDLRLSLARAEAALRTRARPISEVLFPTG